MTDFNNSSFVLPPRSVLWAKPVTVPSGNPTFEMACDCATVTIYEFDVTGMREPAEIPISCDGCQSVHWVTITPAPDDPVVTAGG